MRFTTLADWLTWQETLHPNPIDLGLTRVREVWARLRPADDPARLAMPVITVGGTNGKGSTVAWLEAWYRAAGYRVCAYTSPHLLHYNERLRIDGANVADADLCAAFARIDAARGDISLTYFEFGTLAALDLFSRAAPDLVILEVGLGGRLDAVNIIDADVAVVTGIARDHTAWLGEGLDEIAAEKAGIFRAGRPAIIGQRDAPTRLRAAAEALGATVYQLGREFDYVIAPGQWAWHGPGTAREALPAPALRGRFQYDNAAAALCASACLADRLPLPNAALRAGLCRVRMGGRFTVYPGRAGRPTWVLDVAHNPQAAAALADNLAALPCVGRRHAVFAVLADKDPAAISAALAGRFQHWHLAGSAGGRGLAVADLAAAVAASISDVPRTCYADVAAAIAGADAMAGAEDCVVVFGSFTTVEVALRLLPD